MWRASISSVPHIFDEVIGPNGLLKEKVSTYWISKINFIKWTAQGGSVAQNRVENLGSVDAIYAFLCDTTHFGIKFRGFTVMVTSPDENFDADSTVEIWTVISVMFSVRIQLDQDVDSKFWIPEKISAKIHLGLGYRSELCSISIRECN